MSKLNKIQKVKEQLAEEMAKPNPDQTKIAELRKKIVLYGIGLTKGDINQF